MIDPEHLAAAARVARVQPYPTQLIVMEDGLRIEARSGDLTSAQLVPWARFEHAPSPAMATGEAFQRVRGALKAAREAANRAKRRARRAA